MTSVLGMSVGASAVRFARRDTESSDGPTFRTRSTVATLERPAEPPEESIETALIDADEIVDMQAIGVAYRNEAQADVVRAALARLEIDNFHLVPEVTAALEMLEASGNLGEYETLVFYDLGSSGLTVTVVDRASGIVLSTARSDRISGDLVDRLIYEHHLELHRFTRPTDAAAQLALAARCRDAKEQLSTRGAVCMPGEGGLLLLSQDSLDSLIDGPVKTSARLTREVIDRSGRTPDAAVLIGGGANIPLVTSVMESWLDLPVIVPDQPELVAAEGAALLARPSNEQPADTALTSIVISEPNETSGHVDTGHTAEDAAPQRKRRRMLAAGGAVTVAAVLGLGTFLLQGSQGDAQPGTTVQNIEAPPARQTVPLPSTPTDVAAPLETTSPSVEDQPVVTPQTAAPASDPTQSPTRTSTSPQVQEPVATETPPPPPEPAPLVPGLPQLQLPTIPPLPLPELPRIPGL